MKIFNTLLSQRRTDILGSIRGVLGAYVCGTAHLLFEG